MMESLSTSAIVAELYASSNEKVIEVRGDSKTSHFALLRLPCRNKEEFVEWLRNHQSMTGVTFRVKNVRPFKGITIVYKAEFRCQHNTYPYSHKSRNCKPSKQHTGCESSLKVTIKSTVEGRRVRSQDELRANFPTIVQVNHNHNHEIKIGDYKDPTNKRHKRKRCSVASSQTTTVTTSTVEVDESLSAATTGFYQLPEIARALEEPQSDTLFAESTFDQICFFSQETDVCYDWKDAETLIIDTAATISNFLKSRFSSNPSGVMGALKTFQDGVNSLETESDFLAALRNFGRERLLPVETEMYDSVESAEGGSAVKRRYEVAFLHLS